MTYEMFQMTNLKNLEGKSISSVGDSLVKHFQSQEGDWDLKILEELCSLKLLGRPNKSNHVFFFLKMLKAYSITIRDGRSP
ncbi:methyl transferase [Streptococcus pneumoniae]|nr:methyl transferase [Streptococcus pneumoniae]COO88236.1 methyl transferase [Streptococcus pneumoniae]